MATILLSLLVISSHIFLVVSADLCKTNDYFTGQMQCYKENHPNPDLTLTLTNGAPLQKRYMTSLNSDLLDNQFFIDSVTHVLNERIPERLVHASGIGAYGYFEVTHPFDDISKAKLFSKKGKRTPLVTRFSNSFTAKGASDTARDVRGFAVRFDTEDGLFSIPALNVPVFIFKDVNRLQAFSHGAAGTNSATNSLDQNMLWDFVLSGQEGFFTAMFLYHGTVTPNGYDRIHGFSIHTYQLENAKGETHFARFHWIPEMGVAYLNATTAALLAGTDSHYLTKKLYNQIKSGNYPKFSLYAQVLSEKDVKKASKKGLDVFDVTRFLFVEDYPLRKIGTMVLNATVLNHFAETEQLAFCPSQLVPGIIGAPDQIFKARKLAYRTTQYYRLGSNFYNSEVNRPKNSRVVTNNRNGILPTGYNGGDMPPYYPNSFNGATISKNVDKTTIIKIKQDPNPTNFGDAKRYYEKVFSAAERLEVSSLMAQSLSVTADDIQKRALALVKSISTNMFNDVAPKLAAIKAANAISG